MSELKILYPHDYFNEKKTEVDFEEESFAMSACCSVGVLKTNHIQKGDNVLYRGWMLSQEEYEDMNNFVLSKGARLLIPYSDYENNHYFEGWYSTVKSHSIESVVFKDKEEMLKNLPVGWSSYFIKDAVKSLTTSKGSIARNEEEIKEILTEIEKYKGIERYIVLRKVVDLSPDTEKRYFCVKGKVFSSLEDSIPDKVKEIGYLLKDRLFVSIDMCEDSHGKSWLIETGDGQVSDLKEWKPESFIRVIREIGKNI